MIENILHIDSDSSWRDVVARAMGNRGVNVASFENFDTDKLKSASFDMVITEVDQDLKVAKAVKELNCNIPVCIISASLTIPVLLQAAQIGVDSVIVKQDLNGIPDSKTLADRIISIVDSGKVEMARGQ